MDIREEKRPLCKCHEVVMFWHKDKKYGGYWRCRIKKQQNYKKYSQTEKGKKAKRKAQKKYWQTQKGKENKKRAREKIMNDPIKRMLKNTKQRLGQARRNYGIIPDIEKTNLFKEN